MTSLEQSIGLLKVERSELRDKISKINTKINQLNTCQEKDILKDYGVVYLKKVINPERFTTIDAFRAIENMLTEPLASCYDITNEKLTYSVGGEEVEVLFKLVHFSIQTAESVQYRKVIFKEA